MHHHQLGQMVQQSDSPLYREISSTRCKTQGQSERENTEKFKKKIKRGVGILPVPVPFQKTGTYSLQIKIQVNGKNLKTEHVRSVAEPSSFWMLRLPILVAAAAPTTTGTTYIALVPLPGDLTQWMLLQKFDHLLRVSRRTDQTYVHIIQFPHATF